MRADPGMHAGESIAERVAQLLDHVGFAVERAARQQKDRIRTATVDMLLGRLGEGTAIDDALHRRKAIGTAEHGVLPGEISRACASLRPARPLASASRSYLCRRAPFRNNRVKTVPDQVLIRHERGKV